MQAQVQVQQAVILARVLFGRMEFMDCLLEHAHKFQMAKSREVQEASGASCQASRFSIAW